VHEALFGPAFSSSRVTSLKRDEERSFRSAPFARPYYVCAALSAASLAPSRGLLAVSTWPLARRTVGPLSPRVDFLTAALRVAEAVERMPGPAPAASRLLLRFAAGIPGAAPPPGGAAAVEPSAVRQAAGAELSVHADADARVREAAAGRAAQRLSTAEQLFGLRPPAVPEHGRTGFLPLPAGSRVQAAADVAVTVICPAIRVTSAAASSRSAGSGQIPLTTPSAPAAGNTTSACACPVVTCRLFTRWVTVPRTRTAGLPSAVRNSSTSGTPAG
jgi:hypothetical protein